MRTKAIPGGRPPLNRGQKIQAPCPVCDATPGERCRNYKVVKGERQYIINHRSISNTHGQRGVS